jgi:exonuclease VII large subunit
MTSSADIAKAIADANGNVLAIIRGGGDSHEFALFDTLPVLKALAGQKAYRILGIGHSTTSSLADLVCDCRTDTPTEAGVHIWEMVEKHKANELKISRLEKEIETLRSDLLNARNEAAVQMQSATRGRPHLITAMVVGAIFVLIAVIITWLLKR